MAFSPVVFGSYIVGTGFTDGASISNGGLRCFIKPTANIGSAPLDVTITYVDQYGNTAETTVVSTSVAANTTSGNHIEVTLNTGDTGIQDITSVSVTGGTAGDRFNLESWNEGIGKSLPIIRATKNDPWENLEPIREVVPVAHTWYVGETVDIALSNVLESANKLNRTATMETEVVEPGYANDFNIYGSMATVTNKDDTLKRLRCTLVASLITLNESTQFKWLWSTGAAAYVDTGFYQVDFDFALNRGSLFTFEVCDKDLVVKFTRSSNTGGWTTPGTIQSYCGQEILWPASYTKDGNTMTEWRHYTDEVHWIIFDLGAGAKVGGAQIFWRGLDSGFDCDVETSNDLSYWELQYENWDVSTGAGTWREVVFPVVTARYIRLMFWPYNSGHSLANIMDVKFYLLEHQTLLFKSLAFEVRLRCSTGGTATGLEYLDVRNVKISKYKSSGTITSNFAVPVPNISAYDEILFLATTPAGTGVKFQLAFSDNGSSWSNYSGPDGTSGTYYTLIGEPIAVPSGLTGYYYKWKAILTADGRETPIFDDITIWLFVKLYKLFWTMQKEPSIYMATPNPQMMAPSINLFRACARATAGYPDPGSCTGGSYLPEVLSGHEFDSKIWILIRGSDISFLIETLSGRDWVAKHWVFFKSWMESVVGQVVSGFVRDQNENIILEGIKMVITSSITSGVDQMNPVNPITGFYQIFVKNTKYDNRYLLVNKEGKTFDLAYSKYGLPDIIDGTTIVPSPQDMHFWKPNQICGKSVAYVGSLVSY